MNHSIYNKIDLINSSKIDEVVIAIKERGHAIKIDHAIHLDLIFDILMQGYSLSEIVQETANQIEKCIIVHMLEYTNGNKSKAARILQINYKTLYYKIKRYCL